MPEPERSVIRLRYGLDGDQEPQTSVAIARALGIDPDLVSRIESRALEELARRRELEAVRAA